MAEPPPPAAAPLTSPSRDHRPSAPAPEPDRSTPDTAAPTTEPSSSARPTSRPSEPEPPPRTTTSETQRSSSKTEPEPDPAPRSAAASIPAEIVRLVNEEREDVGCDPLSTDSRLIEAAQEHSDDMARRGYFSHTTPEGGTFSERIREAGYPSPGAENIAMGQSSARAVMDTWMSSPTHRSNILDCDLESIGVGVTTTGWYWTQDFGY